jgi:hypothetical protein
MSNQGEVMAHMISPVLAGTGRIALLIVIDGPTRDDPGPFVLNHEICVLAEENQSVWPLAKVAQGWAETILSQVPGE